MFLGICLYATCIFPVILVIFTSLDMTTYRIWGTGIEAPLPSVSLLALLLLTWVQVRPVEQFLCEL